MDSVDLDIDACYRAIRTRDPRFDGRLFSCVKTTGIYCRPICPARTPKRENVLFVSTAAAAQEAGFRPCLRCRPETAPQLAAWRGTSNTVTRALALIETGTLDTLKIGDLADRLGVGERQLRRLFQKHLGASPVAVAQTRRVLLALQLLRETRLPVTDVALAAGFGSIRRFNEVFQRLFDRPPSVVRDRAKGWEHPSHGDVTVLLHYRPPYDWQAMLAYLRARALAGIERVDGGRYIRTIAFEGVHGFVVVEPARGDALKATIRFPRVSVLPAIIARLRRVFDLAADPQAIAAHLGEDSLLAPLVAARPGLRVPGAWDGFELAVRAVLGQQITVAAAARLAAEVVSRYGDPLRVAHAPVDGLTRTFPRPECLASVDLRQLRMPAQRAKTLVALASTVVSHPEVLTAGADPAECIRRLRLLPGIGEWTAQYIAMRELREPDAFPAEDVGLGRALASRGHAKVLTAKRIIAIAEPWRPWRAYAAQHLWSSLRTGNE